MLVDRFPSVTLLAIHGHLASTITSSSEAQRANSEDWWRLLEAAFTAIGSVSQSALEILEDEKAAGRQPSLDLNQLLVSVVPGLLTQSRT